MRHLYNCCGKGCVWIPVVHFLCWGAVIIGGCCVCHEEWEKWVVLRFMSFFHGSFDGLNRSFHKAFWLLKIRTGEVMQNVLFISKAFEWCSCIQGAFIAEYNLWYSIVAENLFHGVDNGVRVYRFGDLSHFNKFWMIIHNHKVVSVVNTE